MTEFELFNADVRALLDSLATSLSQEEYAEVRHLIEHDELGEALRTMAWIIVEGQLAVEPQALHDILKFSEGLVLPEHLPPGFKEKAVAVALRRPEVPTNCFASVET